MLNSKSTCFEQHEKLGVACKKKDCKNWIKCKTGMNCVLIAAKEGPKTLQEIGEIFDLTRMRICQIEKNILGKLKSSIPE
jgi:hypothetical protein|tara:strand:+ start:453 stop:692 length:240 start_codon:yes stop_codon:yes gene_type:complete